MDSFSLQSSSFSETNPLMSCMMFLLNLSTNPCVFLWYGLVKSSWFPNSRRGFK